MTTPMEELRSAYMNYLESVDDLNFANSCGDGKPYPGIRAECDHAASLVFMALSRVFADLHKLRANP